MKKLKAILFILTFCTLTTVIAQNSKVTAAWRYLEDFATTKDTTSLLEAQKSIDIAAANEATKESAKTWFYKGRVYQLLFETRYQSELLKLASITDVNKKTLLAYGNCNLNQIETAYNAYLKAKALDKKENYTEELANYTKDCAIHFENSAVANYNKKNYNNALIGFEKAMEINSANGKPDTNNLVNAKLSAEMAENKIKTDELYKKMLELKVGKALTYHNYHFFILNTTKDTLQAQQIIQNGRAIYPNDIMLLTDETNFYLQSKKEEDIENAIGNLKKAIAQNPTDASLPLALGYVYDKMATKEESKLKSTEYDELFNNAEKYYQQAYHLNKEDGVVVYNLGALYNNKAKRMLEIANSIKDDKKYKEEAKKANDVLVIAKPYLEDALRLTPNNCAVIAALKRLYLNINSTEQLKAIAEKQKTAGCN